MWHTNTQTTAIWKRQMRQIKGKNTTGKLVWNVEKKCEKSTYVFVIYLHVAKSHPMGGEWGKNIKIVWQWNYGCCYDDDADDDGIDVDTAIEKDMTSHKAFIALKYANVLYIFPYTIYLKAFCNFFTRLCCVTSTQLITFELTQKRDR